MTKLESLFTNQEDKMRDAIANMEVSGCVENFVNYVQKHNTDGLSPLEKQFISKLSFFKLMLRYKLSLLDDTDKDYLISELAEIYRDGYYGLYDRSECDIAEMLLECNEANLYPIIKDYMQETLNDLIVMNLETEKMKEERMKQTRIRNLAASIESTKGRLEKETEELEALLK